MFWSKGPRQRTYDEKPIMSQRMKVIPLRDAAQEPLHRYAFYVHLLTKTPWRVPVLHGRLPRVPDANAKSSEKGLYGLFLMMLFRCHRRPADLIDIALGKGFEGTEEEAWIQVSEEFDRWRKAPREGSHFKRHWYANKFPPAWRTHPRV